MYKIIKALTTWGLEREATTVTAVTDSDTFTATIATAHALATTAPKVELAAQSPSFANAPLTASFAHCRIRFGDDLTAAASATPENVENWTFTFENGVEERFGSLQSGDSICKPFIFQNLRFDNMLFGTSYTFSLVKREVGKLDIRTNYSITARSQDIAVAGIVVFRNQKHEGSAIGFPSEALRGSNVLATLRSNPVGEKLNEYYLFLKGNESDIMASMKTIRQL